MHRRRGSVWIGLCPLVILLIGWWYLHATPGPLLLAPMMDLDACLLASDESAPTGPIDWFTACKGPDATAALLVESTLNKLQPNKSGADRWLLGYTLKVPLLALLQPDHNKVWRVNTQAIDKVVQTIRDNPRPLILYLFSTHFSAGSQIESALAQNPDNLGHTPAGPLPADTYYGQIIYPWSVARTDNPLTHYRQTVIEALLQKLCQLPFSQRSQIHGITLLGEVHQLFPDFESGMGFDNSYIATDYSQASVSGFRQHLQSRYTSIGRLNQSLGSDYGSFEDIVPPSKNIRKQVLTRFEEHMDSYAAGHMPISGWVHIPNDSGAAKAVKIYLDGQPVAEAGVHLGRQDVRAAHPELNTADVGWRYNLDFRHMPVGVHRVDLALSQPGQALIHLDTRIISIMDRQQSTPSRLPVTQLPHMQPRAPLMKAYTDQPIDQASYYFNPLAHEWQLFRQIQVLDYLLYFNKLVAQSCLSDTPRYTHQIVPQFNPSWDSGKFAVEASLQPIKTLRTGISLYGETSYGRSLPDWFKHEPHPNYGVTEFHPLVAMNAENLGTLLDKHREQGATFLSFFLETHENDRRVTAATNPFSFDPQNPQFGSDQLYAAIKTLLAKP